jgi:LytS/YehU family sensor histidine kinase
MPRWNKKFNWKRFIVGWSISYLVFAILRGIIEQYMTMWIWGQQNYPKETGTTYYFFDNFYFSIFPIFAATITYIVIYFIRSLQLNQIIQQEKNETEIRFLKSQINPHFIFNTLNNIYYLVYQKSDQALPAIDKLSQLMRYMTYETDQKNIELQKEIKYIEDFIDLEKMRIAGETQVQMQVDIENPNLLIPPLLLLPFIENGFKHGLLTEREQPFVISITQKGNQLELFTQNKTNDYNKDKTKGIGLNNIRKRLELQFPNRHTLTIQEEPTTFTCKLTLEL